ncbi:chorismate mutase [Amycolatopsis sp. NBC_00345]|uniref:chorismate mutase n=1 Tax=Amycolatopsis sp. NBC_00345 TaxID=2975955 RepID=UPI002E26BBD3
MSVRKSVRRFSATIAVVLAVLTLGGTKAMAASDNAAGRLGPLTELVVQRLQVSDQVAAAKFGTGKPIDDPVRERQELAEVRERAATLGIDPDRTVSFFQDQIAASKVVQRGLFDRWTAHPDEAPTTRPDLNEIRAELDQLTTSLLGQLVATDGVRRPGITCRVEVTAAQLSAIVVDRLDALHRNALRVASRSVC